MTKQQSMQWKTRIHLGQKKARMSPSQVKTMLVCFFDHKGIVHYEIHCPRTNGKSTVLFGSTDKVTEIFSEEKTRTLAWFKWILHHDNAPVHDALRVCKFLAKNSTTKMDHPPYSP